MVILFLNKPNHKLLTVTDTCSQFWNARINFPIHFYHGYIDPCVSFRCAFLMCVCVL